jgi:hypothetical protein
MKTIDTANKQKWTYGHYDPIKSSFNLILELQPSFGIPSWELSHVDRIEYAVLLYMNCKVLILVLSA